MGAVIDNGSAVGRVSSQIAKAGSHPEVTVRFVDCFDGRGSGRRRRLTAGQVCVRLARVPQLEQEVKIVSEESGISSGAVYEES